MIIEKATLNIVCLRNIYKISYIEFFEILYFREEIKHLNVSFTYMYVQRVN